MTISSASKVQTADKNGMSDPYVIVLWNDMVRANESTADALGAAASCCSWPIPIAAC